MKKNKLVEHLKTKKKYNTLENEYKTLLKMHEREVVYRDQLKLQYKTEKKAWEEKLYKQEQEIIELKLKLKEVKKDGKSNTRNKTTRVSTKK